MPAEYADYTENYLRFCLRFWFFYKYYFATA